LKDLNTEVERRENLEREIKTFSVDFATWKQILDSNITTLFITMHTEEIMIRLQSKIRLHYLFNVAEPNH
jgi:hypothetical protein